MGKKEELTIRGLGEKVDGLTTTVFGLNKTVAVMDKRLDGVDRKLTGVDGTMTDLTKTVTDLSQTVDTLARITAKGFESTATKEDLKKFVTKEEFRSLEVKMSAGFSLIMETISPMQHDYEALKDDLAPRMDSVEARLTKVERNI